MKKNTDIEKILLNDAEYTQMVKAKIEQDFKQELNSVKKANSNYYVTDIKDAPKDKLFSKFAIYEVLNKNSKTKSYINGIQAEGYLATNTNDRNNLLSGESDSFVSGNYYIKFVKVKV